MTHPKGTEKSSHNGDRVCGGDARGRGSTREKAGSDGPRGSCRRIEPDEDYRVGGEGEDRRNGKSAHDKRRSDQNARDDEMQVALARTVRVLPVEYQAECTQDSHDRNREPDVRIAKPGGLLNEHRRRKRERIKANVDAEQIDAELPHPRI